MKGNTPLFGSKRPSLPSNITNTQKKRIERGYRKIDDHITDKDISGAIKEIDGVPILNPNGVPFQHYKEVDDAVNGLKKERNSLVKSIENPNLDPEVKRIITDVLKDFDIKINEWEDIKKGRL